MSLTVNDDPGRKSASVEIYLLGCKSRFKIESQLYGTLTP